MLPMILVKICTKQKKALVGQIDKASENVKCLKAYSYSSSYCILSAIYFADNIWLCVIEPVMLLVLVDFYEFLTETETDYLEFPLQESN